MPKSDAPNYCSRACSAGADSCMADFGLDCADCRFPGDFRTLQFLPKPRRRAECRQHFGRAPAATQVRLYVMRSLIFAVAASFKERPACSRRIFLRQRALFRRTAFSRVGAQDSPRHTRLPHIARRMRDAPAKCAMTRKSRLRRAAGYYWLFQAVASFCHATRVGAWPGRRAPAKIGVYFVTALHCRSR